MASGSLLSLIESNSVSTHNGNWPVSWDLCSHLQHECPHAGPKRVGVLLEQNSKDLHDGHLFLCPSICLILWWSHLPPTAASSRYSLPPVQRHIFIYFNYLLVSWLPSSSCTMGFGEQFWFQMTDLLFPKLNYTHRGMVLAKLKTTKLFSPHS